MNEQKKLISGLAMSPSEFQELAGISRATYYNILNGSRGLSSLELIAIKSLPRKIGRPRGRSRN